MKKLVVIALALVSFVSFSQQINEKQKQEMGKRLMQRSSPEQRAEIQTKRLAISLDLSDSQQKKVQSALTNHYKENKLPEKLKEMNEDERHAMHVKRLDAQLALKEKMKSILNADQYAKYSQMLDRQMKRGRGKRKGKK